MTWFVVNADDEPVYEASDRFDAEREADTRNLYQAGEPGWPWEPVEVDDG